VTVDARAILAKHLKDADTGVSPEGETLRFSGYDAPEKGLVSEVLARNITEATLAQNPEYSYEGRDRYGRRLVDVPQLRHNQLLYGPSSTTRWSDEQDNIDARTRSYLQELDPEGVTVPEELQPFYQQSREWSKNNSMPATQIRLGYKPGVVESSWERGKGNLHMNLGMFGKALGDLIGSDSMQDWGWKHARRGQRKAQNYLQRVKNFDEVLDDPTKFVTYVTEAVVENLPNLGFDITTGFATGGGAVIAKKLGWGLLKDQVFSKGMQVGMAGAIYPQMVGETKAQMEQEGMDSDVAPFLTGIAKTGAELYGLNRLVRGSAGLIKVPSKTVGEFARRLSIEASKQFGVEAGTESFQQALDFLTLKAIDSNYDIFTEDNWDELRESFFRGGFAGGGTAAMTGGASGTVGMLRSKGSLPEDSDNEQRYQSGEPDRDQRAPDIDGAPDQGDVVGGIPDYDPTQDAPDAGAVVQPDDPGVSDIPEGVETGTPVGRTFNNREKPTETGRPTSELTVEEEQELRDIIANLENEQLEGTDEVTEAFEGLDEFETRRELLRQKGWVQSRHMTEENPTTKKRVPTIIPPEVRAREAIKQITTAANNPAGATVSLNRNGKPWQFSIFEIIKLGRELDHAEKANYESDTRNVATKIGDWFASGVGRLIETGQVTIPEKYGKQPKKGDIHSDKAGKYRINPRMEWVKDAIFTGTKNHPKQSLKGGIFNRPVANINGKWFTVSDLLNAQKSLGRKASDEDLLKGFDDEYLQDLRLDLETATTEDAQEISDRIEDRERSELEGAEQGTTMHQAEGASELSTSKDEAVKRREEGFDEEGNPIRYPIPKRKRKVTPEEQVARAIEEVTAKGTKTTKKWLKVADGVKMSMFPAPKERKGYTAKQVKGKEGGQLILVEKVYEKKEKEPAAKASRSLRKDIQEILDTFYPHAWDHIRAIGPKLQALVDADIKSIREKGYPARLLSELAPVMEGRSTKHHGVYLPGHKAIVLSDTQYRLQKVPPRKGNWLGLVVLTDVSEAVRQFTFAHELGHHLDFDLGNPSHKLSNSEIKKIEKEMRIVFDEFEIPKPLQHEYASHRKQRKATRIREELFANMHALYHTYNLAEVEGGESDTGNFLFEEVIENAFKQARSNKNPSRASKNIRPIREDVSRGGTVSRRVPVPHRSSDGSNRDQETSSDRHGTRTLGDSTRVKALRARLKTPAGLKQAYDVTEKFAKKWFFDADSTLRSIPGSTWLANQLHQQTGEKNTGTPLSRAVRIAAGPFQTRLHRIIKQGHSMPKGRKKLDPRVWNKHSEELKRQSEKIVKELTTLPDSELSPKAKQIRILLDNYLVWMNTEHKKIRGKQGKRGQSLIQHRKNFFPRIYHTYALEEYGGRFNELLVKYHPGMSLKGANQIRKKLIEHGGTLETLTDLELSELPAGFQHAHQRQINIPDSVLAKDNFIETDLATALDLYFHRGAKSIEWERRFGGFRNVKVRDENGEVRDVEMWDRSLRIKDELAKMREAGATEAEIRTTRQVLLAHEGRLGSDMSPKWQKRQDWTQTFLYWNILPFAAISSMMDPFMVLVRNDGDLKAAWKGANQAIQAMRKDRSTLVDLAEWIGVIAEQHTAHAIQDQVEFGATRGSPNRWNERLFHLNGMHNLTKASRLMALSAGSSFLQAHGGIVKKGSSFALKKGPVSKESQRYLDELNLSREDVLKWFNRPPEQYGQPDPGEHDAVISALNQFVDEAILRPDASQRPFWASDPRFKLVFMLKGFTYSFTKTILTRVYTEIRNKLEQKGPVDPSVYYPLLYAGTAIPVAMVSILLKDAIKFSTSDQEPPERDWLDAWSRSGTMGPLEGLIDVRYGYESNLPVVGAISPAFSFFADASTQQLQTTMSKSIPGISWTAGTRDWVQNL